MTPIRSLWRRLSGRRGEPDLTPEARREAVADQEGLPEEDPGEASVDAAVRWLCDAQDHSASADGGVAGHYSLISGWASSYPETTGYILPTLLQYGRVHSEDGLVDRARRMGAWLASIQMEDGAFQGGYIGADPKVPVAFNTGQILIGLARCVEAFGDHQENMVAAAEWLVDAQDPDGCWRRHQSPFAATGEKVIDTHVAWGLMEAARVGSNERWGDAALSNVRWALSQQTDTGWFERCGLMEDASRPVTHAIGYVIRGILEAYRYSGDSDYLDSAELALEGIAPRVDPDGFLSGRLDRTWAPTVDWACLTGSVQIASCFLLLDAFREADRFGDVAERLKRYVRRTVRVSAPTGIRGGVKGSFPVSGDYQPWMYLNWAAKFFVDAHMEHPVDRSSD